MNVAAAACGTEVAAELLGPGPAVSAARICLAASVRLLLRVARRVAGAAAGRPRVARATAGFFFTRW